MPCTTIAIPLQCAATATHRSRRSKGRVLLLQPTQTWPAHEGKRKLRTNQKTPKLPDMERAAQEQNSYEKQKKRSTLQSAFCTESRPVGLGEVRTRQYRPREQRRKKTFGSEKETNFSKIPENPNKVRSRAAKRRPGKKINAHEGMPKNQSRRKVPPSDNECTMKPNVAKAKDCKMSRKRPTF